MRVFFSHSSKRKPIVRQLRRMLPAHVNSWIDEDNLLLGDSIAKTLQEVIHAAVDYVVLIVDENAAESEWVRKEISWTLEVENKTGRTILLPIVLDGFDLERSKISLIADRKYIPCSSGDDASIGRAAEQLNSMLFSLVCRDFERLARPEGRGANLLKMGNEVTQEFASTIREWVFPHREYDPITVEALCARYLSYEFRVPIENEEQFYVLLDEAIKDGLLAGIVYDGFVLYLKEEHLTWKSSIAADAKERIARKCVSFVSNDMTIAFDAGSTTEAVARAICRKIKSRSLTNLRIISNSVSIVAIFMDAAVAVGAEETTEMLEIHAVAGIARPLTGAIVEYAEGRHSGFEPAFRSLGSPDLGFVGMNGFSDTQGFTTESAIEAKNKISLVRFCKKRVIVGHSAKLDVRQRNVFCPLSREAMLVTERSAISESKAGIFRRPGRLFQRSKVSLMLAD